jgi:hypothetical protein
VFSIMIGVQYYYDFFNPVCPLSTLSQGQFGNIPAPGLCGAFGWVCVCV